MNLADYLEFVGDPGRDDVEGWLYPTDAHLLSVLNELQVGRGLRSDILEIGAYKGKSAILLGFFPGPGESLSVCDIFDSGRQVSGENEQENTAFYPDLHQVDFEKNYLRFHGRLPRMHVGPSEGLAEVLAAGSCRLVHIDGGHTYDVARADLETARRVLGPAGVVVVDDWSSAHIPGVAMALWEQYLTGELIPLAFTKGKFYATWDPAGLTAGEVAEAVATRPGIEVKATVRLGRYAAANVTMTPDAWQRYNAGLRAVYSKLYSGGGAPAPQMVGF
ncbi:Methyltransferase domain-containing protein [Micromonospora viridifaciens]|uniref:Methyltransferase domain-containing protein n=1 Tax=Micromonospora viridifaciens TaxID=1881 RepID=A0A1C4ZQP8_MICVI|nr:class I SAM-dependent methyltransferase [Micromonospora viridifaciens]SCF35091.1 Methyltransferase domain-containing protein [Micromonospora viridifaciens]